MTQKTTGFFIIDKPPGITSHDVIGAVRRITNLKQVGHAGTLDPFATGILLVAIGHTTRLIDYTRDLPKTYQAEITLGATSTTDDLTGHQTHGTPRGCTTEEISAALKTFLGPQQQIPPNYAAIKIQGKKLYEYAREGKEVEKKPRPVIIHSINLENYTYPTITITVKVSSGTYIRSLGRDLGEKLGTGAYVSKLTRTSIGQFEVNQSIKLAGLNAENWGENLHESKELIRHMPSIILKEANVAQLQQGKVVEVGESKIAAPREVGRSGVIPASDPESTEFPIAVFAENQTLIGIATYQPPTNSLKPKVNLL